MTHPNHDTLTTVYPPLAGLPPRLQDELRTSGQLVHLPAGRVLFEAGGCAQHLPLVIQGVLRVVRRVASGRDVLLYRVGAGDFCVITVATLLGESRFEATGTVESALSAVLVPKMLAEKLVEQHAPLRRAMFATIAARLSQLMMLVEEVTVAHLDRRLAALLVQHGPTVRTTHQRLADELATAREVVSRILESFELAGLIRLHRGRVDILDPQRLEVVAREGALFHRGQIAT